MESEKRNNNKIKKDQKTAELERERGGEKRGKIENKNVKSGQHR